MTEKSNFYSSATPFTFTSRRSPVFAEQGMVAASQPVAVAAGLDMLRAGGSAADAAVAVAAVLAVVEPCSTGIGGDAFALCYEESTATVHALNGSGRSGAELTLEKVQELGFEKMPLHHGLSVTVPGACAAWCALHERFGRLPLEMNMAPAISLARNGFTIGPVTSELWSDSQALLAHGTTSSFLSNGRVPYPGERLSNPHLAFLLESVAKKGMEAFYKGDIAERMTHAVRKAGGVLNTADFASCHADWVVPLSTEYKGIRVHECPPNGQGIVALSALGILNHSDHASFAALSPERLHRQIEALRLAFADARRYVCDPAHAECDWNELLSADYARMRSKRIRPERRNPAIMHGMPESSSDTVQFCAADRDGNAVSMVNSVYTNFGSGIVPEGLGFVLQNRGNNFTLVAEHPNCVGPSKRPYHTIIPCMTTHQDGRLHTAMGVMGGFMQPQGHVQVLSAMLDDDCDPQTALDRLRFCINADGVIALEEGMPEQTVEQLAILHHNVTVVHGFDRKLFGRGQIILRQDNGLYCGGSDARADGCAFGI